MRGKIPSLTLALSGGLFLLKQVKSLIAVSLKSTFFCGHGQTWHPRLSPAVQHFLGFAVRLCANREHWIFFF
jgi:hypothetical protein